MKEITFIHLSDIHLGLQTHGKLNPNTGRNTRLEDILRSLDYVVDHAISEHIDLVLVAGDIFHRENPNPTEETEFAKRIIRLVSGGETQVVLVLGNHDYPSTTDRASAVDIFPALDIEGVTVCRRPGLYSISTKNGPLEVAALPWASGRMLLTKDEYKSMSPTELLVEVEKRLIYVIKDLAESSSPEHPTIFAAHVAARDAKLSGGERNALKTPDPTVSVGELANPAFTYVALGHVHRHQDLNNPHPPPVVYSGSIERIDFSEEKEKKGFVVGRVYRGGDGWQCEYEFVETPARRFITIDLGDTAQFKEREEEVSALGSYDTKDAVVRVRYTTSTDADSIDDKLIREVLTDAQSLKIEKVFGRPQKLIRQAGISSNMELSDALERYIETKPELKSISKDLKSYAAELIKEIDDDS